MAATKTLATGTVPPRRWAKEDLVKTHQTYLAKQGNAPDGPRPVKQPAMAQAYPASTKSIRDLDLVRIPFLAVCCP